MFSDPVVSELLDLGAMAPGYLCLAGLLWGYWGHAPVVAGLYVTLCAVALIAVFYVLIGSLGPSALLAAVIAMPAGQWAPRNPER